MAAVKIQSYKVSPRGERSLTVTLPKVWTDDLGIKSGDRLDLYRDETDCLIVKHIKEEGK